MSIALCWPQCGGCGGNAVCLPRNEPPHVSERLPSHGTAQAIIVPGDRR